MINMESKKILLQCPCEFMRLGIMGLLDTPYSDEDNDTVINVSSLEKAEDVLITIFDFDIIILTINSMYYNAAELIYMLSYRIPIHHPDSKIIILTEDKCIKAIKRHLKGLGNIGIILEANESVEKIQSELSFTSHSNKKSNKSIARMTCVLSMRELTILKKLLSGKSITQVAKELAINYKTVSHYKRSAMNKLGIRTLHPLFI
ncbi:hypothetical protein Z042_16610 [Chania multitudinisentens RB-25]|uniref:HTH luxR-type domain-containing protein n=1 Tax=Chania multitudinisentens RB-25 TaxID=1441930 RepID=W0LLJ2_9GAMM|nr:LuxR C-terminal-related transcriptional regulator [Chania multitudinisentens]AHG22875.1 hypothetical protein Z042_16610 [Chania multitudinisentens RB-25]